MLAKSPELSNGQQQLVARYVAPQHHATEWVKKDQTACNNWCELEIPAHVSLESTLDNNSLHVALMVNACYLFIYFKL